MATVSNMANTACRTKANESSTRSPRGGKARGSMTADTAEEGRSGGVSRTQEKRRLNRESEQLLAEGRRWFSLARGGMRLLMGEDDCTRVERLLRRASEGEKVTCALEALARNSLARGRAARVLQAAARRRLGVGLWHVHGLPAPPSGRLLGAGAPFVADQHMPAAES